ncbi:carbohydrate ABC transporter substrate-binding protein (CUT1 family) [Paenibacillus taihuensis]|uniref:Carbohydrate ABC transporter substrate-binding protein (CUT1 family) n=1 Tax=Paenibacillus taihuensis TaxID=1156355 RepID=A0A3D9SD72_9BACL|nr:ABC transporter substrate-binding protein [Paenibacillus taihuensis]REE92838.1 carbohydrate ABC transporter substrate-binding protein (CUT1 family) [Paenibacillus taihuensis]
MKLKVSGAIYKLCLVLLCFGIIAACSSNNNSGTNNANKADNTADTTSNTTNAAADTTNNAATDTTTEPAKEELPEVKLTFYYPSNPPGPDQQAVNDEVNKYLKEKINATVDLKPLSFDEYDPKMNTIMASGEEFDIAWASRSWLLSYQANIDKGAFLELTDDMINKYAKEARANVPDKFWPDMKANDGKVYGFPVYQVAAKTKSLVIQKRFADKYNLDISSIHTYKDIEPFLKQIHDNEPGVVPFGLGQNSWGFFTDPSWVGTDGLAVSYKKDDPNYTILTAEQQINEKKDYYNTLHKWYEAGYINEDAPILKNFGDLKKKGNVAVGIEFTTKPGGELDEMNNNGGKEVVYAPISDTYFTGISSAMQIISKTSKNPERALMFMNLLSTDKYLYNLICYGIEGKHYTKKDENYIEPIKDSGYAPNVDWVFGDQFNAYLKAPQTADVWQKTIDLNNNAMVAASYGFSINQDPIKSELANTAAVNNEYGPALETGAVDPAEIMPKYIEKLKAAGQDKIDQEIQKQWDEWLKKQGLK